MTKYFSNYCFTSSAGVENRSFYSLFWSIFMYINNTLMWKVLHVTFVVLTLSNFNWWASRSNPRTHNKWVRLPPLTLKWVGKLPLYKMIHMKTRQGPQCHTCRFISTKIHANAVVDVVWGSKSSCEEVQWYKKTLLHTRRDSHWPKTIESQCHMSQTVLNFQVIEASANESAGRSWLTSAADWHKTCPSLECPSAITFVLLSVWTQLKEAQFKVLPHLNPTSSSHTLTTKSLTHTQGTYSELFKAQLSACMCVKWQSAALRGCAS